MIAYLVILVAVLSRVLPHAGLWNFTAVGGALLYFGARRSWREMLAPLAALIATDCYLTVCVYHYPFHWMGYAPTWGWYLAAMALGRILLLGPTSFFVVSNFAVWASGWMYPHTMAGLGICYVAGLPFYRNDLLSTALVAGLAFGIPALFERMNSSPAAAEVAAR
jgi:hypothetical protein